MSNSGLKDYHQQQLITLISRNHNVERIVLFGSRALNTFKDRSDIDLVLAGSNLTLSHIAEMQNEIEETTIPQKVDILLFHQITSEALLEHIREHGVIWFDRNCHEAGS